ncbi:DUF167 domain-containing protein [Patescibacteria group bacterium]|nr:DUF167 domain-containing protein [Patescibacteria group bacterium]
MLIKVKVFPGSKKEKIVKKTEDSFEVMVREKPIKGMANQAVINLLEFYFKVPKQEIKLIKGFRQRNKIFEVNLKA